MNDDIKNETMWIIEDYSDDPSHLNLAPFSDERWIVDVKMNGTIFVLKHRAITYNDLL